MALQVTHPELVQEKAMKSEVSSRLRFPRPISEPPSPTSSRPPTPSASENGDDDDNEDAEDAEQKELDEREKELLTSRDPDGN